ncbi:MAG: hypothetical protein ACLFTT_15380 [Candidatus Hydrogenedentota bacterium]
MGKKKRKKRRGHYCRICGSYRPNEAFSGKGHRQHICKRCKRMPKAERDAIEHEDEIFGFMRQRNISKKNKARLQELTESPNAWTAKLARLVLQVAEIKPGRKRRIPFLWKKDRALLGQLAEAGFIEAFDVYAYREHIGAYDAEDAFDEDESYLDLEHDLENCAYDAEGNRIYDIYDS